jgi:hypothetical protein
MEIIISASGVQRAYQKTVTLVIFRRRLPSSHPIFPLHSVSLGEFAEIEKFSRNIAVVKTIAIVLGRNGRARQTHLNFKGNLSWRL